VPEPGAATLSIRRFPCRAARRNAAAAASSCGAAAEVPNSSTVLLVVGGEHSCGRVQNRMPERSEKKTIVVSCSSCSSSVGAGVVASALLRSVAHPIFPPDPVRTCRRETTLVPRTHCRRFPPVYGAVRLFAIGSTTLARGPSPECAAPSEIFLCCVAIMLWKPSSARTVHVDVKRTLATD